MSISSEIMRINGNIADAYTAISTKGGTLPAQQNSDHLPNAIQSIEVGITPVGNIQLENQSGTDVTAYATASVRAGSVTLNTPTINTSTGVVTASASVGTSGWVGSAPSSTTLSLTTQGAKTVTPGTSSQTAVAAGRYTTGAVTVAAVPSEDKTVSLSMASGDQTVNASSGKWMTSVTVSKPATLLPENIKENVNIAGVIGTYVGGTAVTSTDFGDGTQGITITDDGSAISLPAKTITQNGVYNPVDDGEVGYGTVTVDVSGSGDLEEFISEQPTTAIFPTVSTIRNYAFAGCTSLTTASFPVCTTIGGSAFYSCTSLTTVSFPVCTTISDAAFSGCTSLTTVSFPVCTTIGSYAFYECTKLTTVSLPVCTTIGSYAFYECTKLTTVSLPVCTSIASYAFYRCTSLTTASFPVCTTIGNGAFNNCTNLTTANFPSCTKIGSNVFYSCTRLTTVSLPVCTSIGSYAFYRCTSLTTASFPVCTSIDHGAFENCTSLTTASFPVCTSIGDEAFYGCTSLTTVSLPVCTTISDYAFTACTSLTTASFPVCTTIGAYAFSRCYNLLSLYLTGSSYVTLSASNAFSSTPIGGYTTSTGGVYGSIYVPASMLNSYKTRTNWSYFSSRFVGV